MLCTVAAARHEPREVEPTALGCSLEGLDPVASTLITEEIRSSKRPCNWLLLHCIPLASGNHESAAARVLCNRLANRLLSRRAQLFSDGSVRAP